MFFKLTAATENRALLKALRILYPSLQELSNLVDDATSKNSTLSGLAVWLVDEAPNYCKVVGPRKGEQDVFVGHDKDGLCVDRPADFKRYIAARAIFGLENANLEEGEKELVALVTRSWGNSE